MSLSNPESWNLDIIVEGMILTYWIAEKLLWCFSGGLTGNLPSRIFWKCCLFGCCGNLFMGRYLAIGTPLCNTVTTQEGGWGEGWAFMGCWPPFIAIIGCWISCLCCRPFWRHAHCRRWRLEKLPTLPELGTEAVCVARVRYWTDMSTAGTRLYILQKVGAREAERAHQTKENTIDSAVSPQLPLLNIVQTGKESIQGSSEFSQSKQWGWIGSWKQIDNWSRGQIFYDSMSFFLRYKIRCKVILTFFLFYNLNECSPAIAAWQNRKHWNC